MANLHEQGQQGANMRIDTVDCYLERVTLISDRPV